MSRARLLALIWLLSAVACGGDDGDDASNRSAQDGGSSCLDVAGTWTIASHCGASLVGTKVDVAQSGCTITTSGSFPGFTGQLQNDGSFNLAGTASGVMISCTGRATASLLSQSCTGNCDVTLTR